MDRESVSPADGATFEDPAARFPARVRRARLSIVSGRAQGRVMDLGDGVLVLGSQPPAEVVLEDASVSRKHAEVRRAPGGWILVDTGSKNGTFVGELRVGSVYLSNGTIFRVGSTEIAFEAREEGMAFAPATPGGIPGAIAESPAMRRVAAALRQFAPTDLSIVLEGETGVGKEVAARALHTLSGRRAAPFVVVDCGALSESLVESELFGHERGAFTGAVAARAGAFEEADGGTIFLDEIGELPMNLQPKLLRALEAREVRRVGSNKVRAVDVRVIAATNRDLPTEVGERRFRADLFFRLSEVRLQIPPLRDRPEDLVPLAEAIAQQIDSRATFGPGAIEALRLRSWPGNVRELGNVVRRAAVAAAGAPIAPEHLAPADLPRTPPGTGGPTVPVDLALPIERAREAVLAAFHKTYLEALLEHFGGDIQALSDHAGVHEKSLYRLLKNAGVKTK